MTIARLRALTKEPTRLRTIANNLLGEVIAVMDRRLDTAVDILKVEPPLKPGSRYVRTHMYSSHWRRSPITSSSSGLRGAISNDMYYAERVGGNEAGEGQLEMHATTGWPLMAVALRDQHNQSLAQELKQVLHAL